jgi:DNA-binding CsgD family transcriptional regulator/PAS domain-containing protein
MTQPDFDLTTLLAQQGRELTYRYANPDLGIEIVHPDDRPLALRMRDEPESTVGAPILVRWQHGDGRIVWAEHRRRPVYDEQGALMAIEGTARDVTAEVALRRERESHRAALQAMADAMEGAVLVTGAGGEILAVNRDWCDLFGVGDVADALVGTAVTSLAERTSRNAALDRFLALVESGAPAATTGERRASLGEAGIEIDHRPVIGAGAAMAHVWICRRSGGRYGVGNGDGSTGDAPPVHLLSGREHQVLRMIGTGKTVSAIAGELNLSVKTVSTYRARLLQKMKMRTNAELMRYVISRGQ